VVSSIVAALLVLGVSFVLTTKIAPRIFLALLRAVGFALKPSPITQRRIARFKRIRRGYWSFLALVTLFVTSLFLELLVNGRALAIHYEDRTAFPAVAEWLGKVVFFADIPFFQKRSDFGQAGESEVDYRRFKADCSHPEKIRAEIEEERRKIVDERAELKAAAPKTVTERMKAASKEKALKRREADLEQREKTCAVFEGGHAWCFMPLYPRGPSEFRHDLEANPPIDPSIKDGIPLGTDTAGRDVLVLLLYGFRISLAFALVIWVPGTVLGTVMGACQGYFGGWADIALQRFEEIWAAIPFLFVVMIVASMITPSFLILVGLMVVLVSWLVITVYMRAEFYREKGKDYVQAAIGCGVSDWRIMTRHILPNALVPIVTLSPFTIVSYIISLVSLDYLGFGLPPGTPSWGNLLEQGLENVQFHPHLVTAPSVALVLTLFGLVLIGEAVREAFDPKVFSRLR
jgi:microcin C transport system permease protein